MDHSTSVKEAIDILLYDDPQGIRKRKLLLELQSSVTKTEFAEQFLDEDGLSIVLQQIKTTTGNVQGALLGVLRGLLVYVNAMDQVAESPDLVDKIYGLLVPPPDGTPVSLSVAKPTLEILIVICGMHELGHKLINQAAKRRLGVGILPYSPLINLLASNDLLTVHNTLLLMNILLKKKKESSELKAKKLVFRWRECGLMSLLTPLTTTEEKEVLKQLSILQRGCNITIPGSWEEASKYKQQYEETKRKCDAATEALYLFQQQQSKMRLLKAELARAHETVKALSCLVPSVSTQYHPSRRFADGGGLPAVALASNQLEPIETHNVSRDITDARKKTFEQFVMSNDLRGEVERIIVKSNLAISGASGAGGRRVRGRHYDPDDDMELPPDDDELPPADDDEPPPPDDEDEPPPPDDDDDAPPPGGAPTAASGGQPIHRVGASASGEVSAGTSTSGPAAASIPKLGEQPAEMTEYERQVAEYEAQKKAYDDYMAQQAAAAAPAAYAAPTAAVGGPPAGAPPPPPPPGRFGAPPPPPPGRGKLPGAAGATAAKPSKLFFKGPAPTKKMKPLHWDKIELQDDGSSVWHKIYNGTACDTAFDYEEFEQLFSQKEVEVKKEVAPKPKKILLLDEGIHRNLSIVLHKLPSIPNVQRALLELDDQTLGREALIAMLAQAPAEDVKKSFLMSANKKPEEEYEPQEKFMAMMIAMPAYRFRVSTWLFTIEWPDNVQAVQKPIIRLQQAMTAILESKYLPTFLGVLLGFGNMMNFGDAKKGNAGAISLALFGRLELTKDNRGKSSLLGHLIHSVKTKSPEALTGIVEELKSITSSLNQIKWDDIEKSVQDATSSVKTFKNQCESVKKELVKLGADADDPYIPRMTEFQVKSESELDAVLVEYEAMKGSHQRVLQYFAMYETDKKKVKPEEYFSELIPFLEKLRKAAQDMAKDARKSSKKGQRLGDGQLSDVVGKLQEQMVA